MNFVHFGLEITPIVFILLPSKEFSPNESDLSLLIFYILFITEKVQ